MHIPRVSIVLPVYNAAPFLEQCIDSILTQSFRDFELIIVNDGSVDQSLEIMHRYARDDNRIVVVDLEKNIGLVAVLNGTVALCKGEYIARFDADDWSVPERIATQVEFLDENTSVGIVGSWIELFEGKSEIWHYRRENDFIKLMLLFKTNGFPHNSILLRKSILQRFSYDPSFKYIEDTALWVKIMLECPEVSFANIPKVLSYYRITDTQVSAKYRDVQNEGYKMIIAQILKTIVPNYSERDIEIHYQLITLSADVSISECDVGSWINTLWQSVLSSSSLNDSYYVIAEKWFKYCIQITNNSQQAKLLYEKYMPEDIGFSFLPKS